MSDERLFPLPDDIAPPRADEEPARYETANRQQVELTPIDLEATLPPGHMARLVWRFVEGLDLTAFYAAIRSREGSAGRPAIDPKILIALWLYATIDGVGSAREVDRLCYSHDAYRWIRGGVSVNYHTLSDFRVRHARALDDLLTQSIASLRHRGVVTLARVAQDGTRVRASAGVGSFRREGTLRACLRDAEKLVARTKRQQDGGPAAPAVARAAAEQLARVDEALAELPAIAATKQRRGARTAPRASSTDPEARVMKMADGGYRPAYNVQFATDQASDAIVGVAVTNRGSDHAELLPMLDQIERRAGLLPDTMLVDGGYVSHAVIDEVTRRGVRLLAPPKRPRGQPTPSGVQRGDSIAVALWRVRMQDPAAQAVYRQRSALAERRYADAYTHRTLRQLLVRSLPKVHAWALWIALAHNVVRSMEIVPHLMR